MEIPKAQQNNIEGKTLEIGIVVAMGKNREIGMEGELLWYIPEDLKRFKELTLGHPIIMGRKTFESIIKILGKPLPGRTNIVITRNKEWKYEGILITHSFEEALEKAKEINPDKIFIGGGAQIYTLALPYVTNLYLTLIDDEKKSDSFFPPYEHIFTKKIFEELREHNGLKYTWLNLEK